jgi:hypothetical protein
MDFNQNLQRCTCSEREKYGKNVLWEGARDAFMNFVAHLFQCMLVFVSATGIKLYFALEL